MLGVCYYPEHWPQGMWQQDAKEMQELGLTYVRIAEFAWSKMEPTPGNYEFTWLDDAIETLGQQGLKVILCTPTATPPKWLIDMHPDILPVDVNTGNVRQFGSRRHYDFSSPEFFTAAMQITQVMAQRYARNPYVVGWQTDNEIACHDTTHSASANAKHAFQHWCAKRYGSIAELNQAWGTIFWSMEYTDFSQIELPVLTLTEPQPAHVLAYRRFSSDQVVHFHNSMIATLRKYAPDQFVTHNFIPVVDTQCNDHALAEKLDFVCYDNYPLGRTDLFFNQFAPELASRYMRTGHPDYATYSFDHMRGLLHRDFWIMEQQPGPVNWGGHNPKPEDGMVRFWSWEAVAHGASTMSYFRWRQAPFAQEQMHAGIKRVDNSKAVAWYEISQFRDELASTGFDLSATVETKVAIVLDEHNQWVTEIERQGDSYNQQQVEFAYYSALRKLGIDVDFISQSDPIEKYALVLAPCLPIVKDEFIQKLQRFPGHFVAGPRTGSKTDELSFAPNLAPGLLQSILPIQVDTVETIRPDLEQILQAVTTQSGHLRARSWCERIILDESVTSLYQYADGHTAIAQNQACTYIGALIDDDALLHVLGQLCIKQNIELIELPLDVRLSSRGEYGVLFNYNYSSVEVDLPFAHEFVLGSATLGKLDVAVFKRVDTQ